MYIVLSSWLLIRQGRGRNQEQMRKMERWEKGIKEVARTFLNHVTNHYKRRPDRGDGGRSTDKSAPQELLVNLTAVTPAAALRFARRASPEIPCLAAQATAPSL